MKYSLISRVPCKLPCLQCFGVKLVALKGDRRRQLKFIVRLSRIHLLLVKLSARLSSNGVHLQSWLNISLAWKLLNCQGQHLSILSVDGSREVSMTFWSVRQTELVNLGLQCFFLRCVVIHLFSDVWLLSLSPLICFTAKSCRSCLILICDQLRTVRVLLYSLNFFLQRVFYVVFYVQGFIWLEGSRSQRLQILLKWLQKLLCLGFLRQVAPMLESFNRKWLLVSSDLELVDFLFKWTFYTLSTVWWNKFFKFNFIQIVLSRVTVTTTARWHYIFLFLKLIP